MKLPEAKKIEVEIFGRKAFLQERTAEERYQIEDAFSQKNEDAGTYNYVLTLTAVASALSCNIKPGFWNWRQNRLFRFSYLKKNLTWTQIEFIVEEIGKLEYGEEYEDLKKKSQKMVAAYQEKLSGD